MTRFRSIRWKKILIKSIICIGILGIVGITLIIGINAYVVSKYKDKILTVEEFENNNVDCIMVLGAHVKSDGEPCVLLRDRLNKGLELYQTGVSDKLLMTGDHGQIEYDEVNAMKNYAIAQGVDGDYIFMDHAGFSTYESMYRAKEVFGVKSMVIVTQKYHLYRALYVANQLGIDAYGVCTEDIEYSSQTKREIREAAARIKDVGYVMFRPEPTYLGEAIPISGSASLADD